MSDDKKNGDRRSYGFRVTEGGVEIANDESPVDDHLLDVISEVFEASPRVESVIVRMGPIEVHVVRSPSPSEAIH